MKKICMIAAAMSLMLASCGTLGQTLGAGTTTSTSTSTSTDSSSSGTSLLGSLLGELVGSAVPLSESAIQGTWVYSSPECRFESENALSKAGGAVAANSIENKLAEIYGKVGIKKGSCSFTFNADKTCVINLGSKTINGTWSLDASTRQLSIVSNTGLLKLNATAYYSVKELSLLFEADKLLTIIKGISAVTGNYSTTLSTLGSAISTYDGLLLGMNLSK